MRRNDLLIQLPCRPDLGLLYLFAVVFLSALSLCNAYTRESPSSIDNIPPSIQESTWRFRGKHPIAYEKAEACAPRDSTTVSVDAPVLLLNGFGVGSFHQHRLIQELRTSQQQTNRNIYAMDYLGQGRSWPEGCDDGDGLSELNLRYCGSTWVEQVIGFLEDVVVAGGQKAHLVGNSVGGHISVFVAAQRPDLVESVTLLNATPVWGSNLPGWSGHLPAPTLPKLVGRYLFDRIRDLNTIETYLNVCYANPSAFDDDLLQQIRSCTTGNGGHAAFASILWSPPITVDLPSQPNANFEDCLQAIQCDTLLVFGSGDPSCTPSIAKRMLELLSVRKRTRTQRYVELSQVGHCPNHEAPKAVAQLLRRWWRAEENRDASTLVKDTVVSEAWGDTTLLEKSYEMIPSSMPQRIANIFAR